ncbi:DUF262 domain-containing protein [Pantoea vagans]|uniref:DUF262 domain-containing protein n=1 Tax=Pantoea vagans TaxID=470934 RepID=UPI003AABC770
MNIVDNIDIQALTTKWLIDGLKAGTIIVDDSFQRRYVWMLKDKISLIETILMGYPIPEIYLWQTHTNPDTGDTNYSVVDGQQRLGAVLSFINDEFKLSTSILEFKSESYANKKFSQLTTDQKSEIWKFKFSIRNIKETVSKESITKLFLRLNKTNTTLNPQELRNAEFNGEFIKLSGEISEESFWQKYNIFNAGDLRRMLDIQFISTIIIFIRMGIEEETTQSALNKAYDLYNESYPEYRSDKQLFKKLISTLDGLLDGKENLKTISKRKTHLYTLFTLSFFLLAVRTTKSKLVKISKSLDDWFGHYIEETQFGINKYDELLEEYRVLSREGVQKKPNRLRRLEILKEYLEL